MTSKPKEKSPLFVDEKEDIGKDFDVGKVINEN